MRTVQEDQLKQTPERAESWTAEDLFASHETVKRVGEQVSDSEISRPEIRTLVAQCSMLSVIIGIVAWLIAA